MLTGGTRVKRRFLIVVLVLGLASAAEAYEILVVQSARIEPYDEALQSFKRAIAGRLPQKGPKQVHPVRISEFTLSEHGGREAAIRHLESQQTDLILAIGGKALSFADRFHDIPIVYVMVPDPQARIRAHKAVTGVGMAVSPEKWVDVTASGLPAVKRVGVIYDPKRNGEFVERARSLAAMRGITLRTAAVRFPQETPGRLAEMAGRIDAFWMLPDLTVVTPQTADIMFLFSLEHRVPIITFAEKYLKQGAMMAVTPDFGTLGRQAAALATRILRNPDETPLEGEFARQIEVRVNTKIATKLGIIVNSAELTDED